MRRLAMTLIAAAAVVAVLSPSQPATAGNDTDTSTDASADLAPVDVLQVSGILDPILVDEIDDAISRAESSGSQALILQMNSRSASISRSDVEALASRIKNSPVPVAIWVGPARARAYGLPAQLLAAAPVTALAPGARIGNLGELISIDGQPADFGPNTQALVDGTMNFETAYDQGVLNLDLATADSGIPALRNMTLALDGLEYNGRVLDTLVEVPDEQGNLQATTGAVRFFKLGLIDQLFHTVASTPVAYLLFIIGLALLVFEFFTAGIGLAGGIGAICLILGSFGLAALPTRPVAAALLIVSMLAFAVDVQVGVPRVWTAIGLTIFIFASVFLYRELSLPILTLLAGIAGIALTFVVGMPSMVRTRFATPTIGREWMIGETGEAVEAVAPEGLVTLLGATWRARTNRATPIAKGDIVRVVAIDGVTLEIEPETGGARDYRERRPKAESDSSL